MLSITNAKSPALCYPILCTYLQMRSYRYTHSYLPCMPCHYDARSIPLQQLIVFMPHCINSRIAENSSIWSMFLSEEPYRSPDKKADQSYVTLLLNKLSNDLKPAFLQASKTYCLVMHAEQFRRRCKIELPL